MPSTQFLQLFHVGIFSEKKKGDKISALASLVENTLREIEDKAEQNEKIHRITTILFSPSTSQPPAPTTQPPAPTIHRPLPRVHSSGEYNYQF